jgi:hypothetical protein
VVLDDVTFHVPIGEFLCRCGPKDLAMAMLEKTGAALLADAQMQAVARCAERVVYLERSVKAWGLWTELSRDHDLSLIQIASGDHRAMALDGD